MVRAGCWSLLLAGLAVWASACTPDSYNGDADAGPGDHDGGTDGGLPTSGLVMQWQNLPTLPGGLGDTIYLDQVRLPLRDVRCIGDSAPGDSRTWVSSLNLIWQHNQAPPSLSFPAAPPGLYSRFEFKVQSGEGNGYELTGKIVLPGHPDGVDFKIHDKQMLPISVPLVGVELDPGEVQVIEVRVDIALVMAAIDWEHITVNGDEIEIDEESPEIGLIRAALSSAISAHAVP